MDKNNWALKGLYILIIAIGLILSILSFFVVFRGEGGASGIFLWVGLFVFILTVIVPYDGLKKLQSDNAPSFFDKKNKNVNVENFSNQNIAVGDNGRYKTTTEKKESKKASSFGLIAPLTTFLFLIILALVFLYFLAKAPLVSAPSSNYCMPTQLTKAIDNDNYELVKQLISNHGYKGEKGCKTRVSAIEYLALKGDEDLLFHLDREDPTFTDRSYFPLGRILDQGSSNIISLLIKNSQEGNSLIVDVAFSDALRNDNIVHLNLLIENGLNLENPELDYAIEQAIKYGKFSTFEFLINNGLDVNRKSRYGSSDMLIREAIEHGKLEHVKLLVERGVNINAKIGTYEKTLLILAVDNNQIEVAKFLVSQGADVDYVDRLDRQAIDYINYNELSKEEAKELEKLFALK